MISVVPVPARQVRARCTAGTVMVYQAYPPEIAVPAVAAGRFMAPAEEPYPLPAPERDRIGA